MVVFIVDHRLMLKEYEVQLEKKLYIWEYESAYLHIMSTGLIRDLTAKMKMALLFPIHQAPIYLGSLVRGNNILITMVSQMGKKTQFTELE